MKKSVVVYYSKTGHTRDVAKRISVGNHFDNCSILPVIPYSEKDLDEHDPNSRSYQESKNPSIRPDILDLELDINQYDVIFLGFPVWYEDMPRIIYTFLERYDFSNKIIAPFATNRESSLEEIIKNIQTLCPNATVFPGKLLNGCPSTQDLSGLVQQLPLE